MTNRSDKRGDVGDIRIQRRQMPSLTKASNEELTRYLASICAWFYRKPESSEMDWTCPHF